MCNATDKESSFILRRGSSSWWDTWRNHLVHVSVYGGMLAVGGHGVLVSSGITVWASYLYFAMAMLAALLLHSEVAYMIQRRHLPPGDSGWPVVGHLPAVMKNAEASSIRALQKYGPLVTRNLCMRAVVLVTHEDDVRWANAAERQGKTQALLLPHFKQLLGEESIMVQSGEAHKRLRKVFEPAFTPVAIRDYAAAMDRESQAKLAEWSATGTFQDPREWALLAMRIFFICAFGQANQERMVRLAYLFENWVKGFQSPIPVRIPGTGLARAHRFKDELGEELRQMIHEFKTKHPTPDSATSKSVLGRLCYAVDEHGNLPSETVLVDNLRFFLFAGFDTTKASFGGISHFLKQHPHVEQLLVEEVQQFQGSEDGVLDVDQLKNEAPILNAVLAESWRLTAPLSSHSTVAVEDLDYKGYHIPKGTFIGTDHQAHAKLNNNLYPNAANFVFERWLPKDHPLYDPAKANTTEIDYNVMSTKFRTFNHGSHMCLGGHFAKMEVRIVMTRLFQSYHMEIRNETVHTFPTKQLLNEFKLVKRQ